MELWHPNLKLSPIGENLYLGSVSRTYNGTQKKKILAYEARSFLQTKMRIHDQEDDIKSESSDSNGLQGPNLNSHPHLSCKCKFVKLVEDVDSVKELPESPEEEKKALFEPEKNSETEGTDLGI